MLNLLTIKNPRQLCAGWILRMLNKLVRQENFLTLFTYFCYAIGLPFTFVRKYSTSPNGCQLEPKRAQSSPNPSYPRQRTPNFALRRSGCGSISDPAVAYPPHPAFPQRRV